MDAVTLQQAFCLFREVKTRTLQFCIFNTCIDMKNIGLHRTQTERYRKGQAEYVDMFHIIVSMFKYVLIEVYRIRTLTSII